MRELPLLADSYDVRGLDGSLRFVATRDEARRAIAEGIAEPVGRSCVKFLRIKREAVSDLRAGSRTTAAVRADSGCRVYGAGQLMGNSHCLREHRRTHQ
jgi:hypothetical protein